MVKDIFPLLYLFLFSIPAFTQSADSLLRLYNTQTIYRYGNVFRKGNERISFSGLKHEFSFSHLGMADYQMASKYRAISYATNLATTGSMLAFATLIDSKPKAGYIFFGTTMVLSLSTARYRSLSARHLDRALWQRNKDLLFR